MVIIAFLTDFGTKDYFVGAMKGVILAINENVHLVDITHEIEPHDIKSAGFNLRCCHRDFRVGTIFVAVVDPGVGSERRAILVETADYFFIAPDNGLLSFVFDEYEEFRVFEITAKKFFAENVSASFHGRDIFAPVAAHLSKGVNAGEFGREIEDFVRFETTRPRRLSAHAIEAEIVAIDRFGNLVTNLRKEDLPEKFALEIGGKRIANLRRFFAENESTEAFMIFGSAGFLEVSVYRDSAKNILHAEIGQKIKVLF